MNWDKGYVLLRSVETQKQQWLQKSHFPFLLLLSNQRSIQDKTHLNNRIKKNVPRLNLRVSLVGRSPFRVRAETQLLEPKTRKKKKKQREVATSKRVICRVFPLSVHKNLRTEARYESSPFPTFGLGKKPKSWKGSIIKMVKWVSSVSVF